MLLTLWLYAIGQGIGSAREIARLTTNDDAFRFIVGDLRPSHDVIARFRVDHGAAFDKLLTLMDSRGLQPAAEPREAHRLKSAPTSHRGTSARTRPARTRHVR